MPDVKPVVAIVDPISTGASLAKFLSEKGYPLVRVFSDTLPDEVRCSWKSRWLSLQPGSTEACFSAETVPRAARASSAAPAAPADHVGLVVSTPR